MGMKNDALVVVGLVIVHFAQVGLLIAAKKAMLDGMTNFTFVCYSNALAAIVLLLLSFLCHRSAYPPINFSILGAFLLLGLLGFLIQSLGYTGVRYISASVATALLSLIPGFTFILAVIFRQSGLRNTRRS